MERQRAPPKGREAENGSRGIDSRGRIPERLCRCHRGMSYKYYSPLRPLSLGTFPKPQGNEILHIENYKERQNVPEIARQAWGYIEYKEALTEIEAAAYELIPSNCISEMENIEARR